MSPRAPGRALLLAGIVLVALNLRAALAGVGPLVGEIRAATGLSNTALGLLTTLPLLAFAAFSPLTPVLTRRVGIERALAAALLLIGAGTAVRAVPSVALLFGGTLLLGVGIALGNVLLPALVKRDYPGRFGPMTSLYSGTMSVGAMVAAGVSVPLAALLGWRGALGVWAVPAVFALVLWTARSGTRATPVPATVLGPSLRSLGRTLLAWKIALFMGLQSLTFYVLLAWLPDLLQGRGMDAGEAGWMLALTQATGILGSIAIPLWAGGLVDQRRIVWVTGAIEAAALAGLLLPGLALVPLWVGLMGFALGGTFALSLLLLVLRSADPETATALSGMAQSVAYLVAAGGPALFGLLHDLAGGWELPLLFLGLVLVGKMAAGLGAGRPGEVWADAA